MRSWFSSLDVSLKQCLYWPVADEERRTFGKTLEECQIELRSTKANLAETETELKLFHSKVEELKTELSTLRESVKK